MEPPPPPPPPLPPPPPPPPPPAVPSRYVSLADLPPAVAERLRFDVAAPRRLRGDRLPAEARQVFHDLWDAVVADVYDEVAGMRRTRLFNRAVIERVLTRVANRVQQAERAVVVTAVYWPLPAGSEGRHVAVGGASGAAAAAAEELAAYGSLGTGATVAVVSAIVGELFETYVAASGRAHQYARAGRSPGPDLVVADLAEALGLGAAAGRRTSHELTRQALSWLDGQVVRRLGRRYARGLVPVAGIAIGAGASGVGVRRVLRAPLRPPSEDEVIRMARDIVQDPAARDVAYAADRARFGAPLPTAADPALGAGPGAHP